MINPLNKGEVAPVSLEQARKLAKAIEQVIRGKSEAIEMTLVTLLSGGHLLIEDVPGIGKTTLGACARKMRFLHFSSHSIYLRFDAGRYYRSFHLEFQRSGICI